MIYHHHYKFHNMKLILLVSILFLMQVLYSREVPSLTVASVMVSEFWNKDDDPFTSAFITDAKLKEGSWEIFGEVCTSLNSISYTVFDVRVRGYKEPASMTFFFFLCRGTCRILSGETPSYSRSTMEDTSLWLHCTLTRRGRKVMLFTQTLCRTLRGHLGDLTSSTSNVVRSVL
jgi:hypothetical protein